MRQKNLPHKPLVHIQKADYEAVRCKSYAKIIAPTWKQGQTDQTRMSLVEVQFHGLKEIAKPKSEFRAGIRATITRPRRNIRREKLNPFWCRHWMQNIWANKTMSSKLNIPTEFSWAKVNTNLFDGETQRSDWGHESNAGKRQQH